MSSQSQAIACDLSAIPEDERHVHEASAESVFESIESARELRDGYAFRFPAKTGLIEQIGAFIARERLCCPFFNFELELKPDDGPVWLRLTGGDNVKKYIKATVLSHWNFGDPA